MVFLLLEGVNVGKLVGVLRRQLKFAPLPADQDLLAVAFEIEFFVGAFRQDPAEAIARQDHAAGGLHRKARHLDPNANLQVGPHHDGRVVGHVHLDALQDGFRAPRRGHARRHLEGPQEFVTIASRFHGLAVPFFLSISSEFILVIKSGDRMSIVATARQRYSIHQTGLATIRDLPTAVEKPLPGCCRGVGQPAIT